MKAIIYTKYGTPDVLKVKQIAKPAFEPNDVLVRIKAVEVTKADCELRSFRFPVQWFWLPLRIALGVTKPKKQVLGGYFSGQIESVGKNVKAFQVGEEVFGCAGFGMGAYAEYLVISDSSTLLPKPVNLSFENAAAVPLGGLNALHYLRRAKLKKGEKVLINGAGGSIGTFAVQIAKSMGAIVTAVDSGIKENMLREIGADEFVDYTKQDFTQSAQQYDVIFNMVAGVPYSASIKALKPNGRYLLANPRLSDMFRSVITTRYSNKIVMFSFAGEKTEELSTLKDMLEAEEISSVVDIVYPMEQVAEAHRKVEAEERIGSVVISINSA
ncbi:NAD(P)-dependent alcohol dehydrogenase [Paraglaciecola sp.]|uniref:NAD(P)-dependent alcohol dehydrogenase n=1 Tax=Paraglaciecola sp. TaxID=1920173 RepID=UPI003EF48C5F